MEKKLRKSLQIYFSKIKKIRAVSLPNPPTNSSLFSVCKYPKTPSFDATDRHRSGTNCATTAATLSDVDRFLFENFQSLYIHGDDDPESDPETSAEAIKSSDRFFASPRTSNSLADDAGTTTTSTSSTSLNPEEIVAVTTLSRDPYDDFLRSMEDMVDARHVEPGQPLDWEFMEELLFSYLELNDRVVHKYILRAFADLTVSLQRRVPPRRRKVAATAARRKKAVRE